MYNQRSQNTNCISTYTHEWYQTVARKAEVHRAGNYTIYTYIKTPVHVNTWIYDIIYQHVAQELLLRLARPWKCVETFTRPDQQLVIFINEYLNKRYPLAKDSKVMTRVSHLLRNVWWRPELDLHCVTIFLTDMAPSPRAGISMFLYCSRSLNSWSWSFRYLIQVVSRFWHISAILQWNSIKFFANSTKIIINGLFYWEKWLEYIHHHWILFAVFLNLVQLLK